MNRPRPDSPARCTTKRELALTAVLAAVVCLVAISGKSFWIDEALTGVKARQPTFGSWWQAMVHERASDLQMPLYMFYVWVWEKLFGSGERVLRLANLPWVVAGVVAFLRAFPPGDDRRRIAVALALCCPFAWYYLDEARPYAMQLGASLLVAASLYRWGQSSDLAGSAQASEAVLFLIGILALCGSSLLGMIWAAAALAAAPKLLPRGQIVSVLQKQRLLWAASAALLLGFGLYYLWTLKIGARASAAATTHWASPLFIVYELLGFAGLGPGRLEIRAGNWAAFHAYWPWLAGYGFAAGIVLGAGLWNWSRSGSRQAFAVGFWCIAPGALILLAGGVAHFRVLGRHFTPLMPVLLLLFASGGAALWSRRSLCSRLPVALFCGLSLVSCLSIRFAARHQKDDYRAAAALARAALANGQQVWWNAAEEGAGYYDVPLATADGSSAGALLVRNPAREWLNSLPPPRFIITSKPDVYDGPGTLSTYIRERGYKPARELAAFVLWQSNAREARP